jgi:DNA-binding CsgD family transcriptional regulator
VQGPHDPNALTERERDVVQLVTDGLKNAEIAKRIGTTEHVIKNYLRAIYDKFGLWNRVELALWSLSRRWLMPIDPANRATWPTGDKLWTLAQAIAVAEGYGPPANNPTRLCNPGDISDGQHLYGSEAHSGSQVTHFPDQQTGWNWLHDKLQNIFNGSSRVFRPAMTFEQFAQTYAGDWQNWLANVTGELKISADTTLEDWYSGVDPTSGNDNSGTGTGSSS